MIRPEEARGHLLGVVGERAGEEHLAAAQDELPWLLPGEAQVQQGLIAGLNEVGTPFDVSGDEIAACLHQAQLSLQLGRVEHVGGEPPRLRELGVEPGELPGADPFGEQPGQQDRLHPRG